LSPRSLAGPLAAILFALHPSNNEAVVWMSARFDLLATCLGLAAVCWMVRGWTGAAWVPAILFFPALLSKEAAVALPLAPAGWRTFRLRGSAIATIARVAPWLLILGTYSALRQFAGGVSAVGGASRLPKLAALAVIARSWRCRMAGGTKCDWLQLAARIAVVFMLVLAVAFSSRR
jgi:hypothetical protein